MARLRQEEEARAYERMINPPPPTETFRQRFPSSAHGHLFPSPTRKDDDDEMTYRDVDRQVALIFNVLVSIVACSVAIWVAARHWSTPSRLALSMAGSIVVAVAEVVVYTGYLRRLGEAKDKERKKVERKEIMESWVIEPSKEKPPVKIKDKKAIAGGEDLAGLRLRGTNGG
jgi:TMEM199 family protein